MASCLLATVSCFLNCLLSPVPCLLAERGEVDLVVVADARGDPVPAAAEVVDGEFLGVGLGLRVLPAGAEGLQLLPDPVALGAVGRGLRPEFRGQPLAVLLLPVRLGLPGGRAERGQGAVGELGAGGAVEGG